MLQMQTFIVKECLSTVLVKSTVLAILIIIIIVDCANGCGLDNRPLYVILIIIDSVAKLSYAAIKSIVYSCCYTCSYRIVYIDSCLRDCVISTLQLTIIIMIDCMRQTKFNISNHNIVVIMIRSIQIREKSVELL